MHIDDVERALRAAVEEGKLDAEEVDQAVKNWRKVENESGEIWSDPSTAIGPERNGATREWCEPTIPDNAQSQLPVLNAYFASNSTGGRYPRLECNRFLL